MAENGQLAPERELARSVKKQEAGDYLGPVMMLLPAWTMDTGALPPNLPPYRFWGYYQERDRVLLSTPRHEAMWGTAIGVAVSKMVSMSWEVESDIPARRKRAQQWLLNAGAGLGVFGWVPFLSMHLRSFLCTGRAFVEIERATPANGSRVINIHHLNPLRCRLTGNPQKPVNYLARDGRTRELKWHQVMVLVDMMDPTEGEEGMVNSAAERAYRQIVKLAAIEQYVYERVSGRRPTSLQFIGGITGRHVEDAIASAQAEATSKGYQVYMGAAIIPIPGDVPLTLVSVPLMELPEGFDPVQERERADLIYSESIGLDPQDLNPALVGRQGLGSTGNQSLVLADKAKGHGLAAWRQQFSHSLNELALDDKTLFSFRELDLRDEQQEAEVQQARQNVRNSMITSGMITPAEARNLAADDNDLPQEFIQRDITAGGALGDDDKAGVVEPEPAETVPSDLPLPDEGATRE